MNKNYLFLLSSFVFTLFSMNAQFSDDFESYPLGAYHGGNWSTWTGNAGEQDIIVSDNYAYDGTKSGFIGGDQIQDVMLGLGNQTNGTFRLSFQMYIPTGKTCSMSIQGTTTATGGSSDVVNGVFNSSNLVFNNILSSNGSPGIGGSYQNVNDPTANYTWQYPEESWFPVIIDFDVDNGSWVMTINGTTQAPRFFGGDDVLGAINIYSLTSNNEVYIDAINFENTLSVNDESQNVFKVYPNPVKDYLYFSSNSNVDLVEVFDLLGRQIISTNSGTVEPKVDFRNLDSGTYYVKATSGDQSHTVKIIKD